MSEPTHLIAKKAALQHNRASLYEKIIRWTWRLLVGGIVGMAVLFVTISMTAIPSFRELEDPNSALASEVLANNNEVLGRYFIENRVPVPYDSLSPHLVNALISTEDERFREHCGIDAQAVGRVIFRTLLMADQSSGGGSTITQQLAKNLYSDRDFRGMGKVRRTFKLIYMKLREWITAVKLERSYTKEEILAMYLNQFNFINNAYGIHAAAEVYFGKNQKNLKIEQAATLVGMLNNPSYFNPNRFPDRTLRRRWIVLMQMRNHGYITTPQFDKLKLAKLDMSKFKKVTFTDDKAPYLCAELKKDLSQILDAPECRKPDGSKYDIYKDGLKIYTTVDPSYQMHAEEAMQNHMKSLQGRLFQVWRGRDPWSYKGKDASAEELQARKDALWSLVRQGDRFQSTWPKYMDGAAGRIKDRYDYELRDIDMERMLQEETKSGSISKMLAAKYVSIDQAATYRKVMTDKAWPELKNQYRALTAAVRKQYDVRVPMKVFTWNNSRYEKDTLMSPMDSLRYHRMFLQTGILAVDPTTSEVKAWVGGINYKYFQYDHIRNRRQVGSTFKPYVYATAIAQQGISPCFRVYDQAVTIPKGYPSFYLTQDWTPKNSTGSYSGQLLTLKEALKNSVNSVSVFLMKQMGDPRPVIDLCKNMGISSEIPNSPSICLGTADLKVFEMAG
ncbi:MAG TPA: transglycosylase domain-containing protein, partial [Saprospiraceae bacterium]|nr:transglycosylase domain-containing protein [Saprospiraceae bacterium]